MRKIKIALLICFIVLFMASCSFTYITKEDDLNYTEIKMVEQADLYEKYHLSKDDYMIYADGKLIDDTSGHKNKIYNFSKLTDGLYENKILETKRGVGIGCHASEISIKYSNVPGVIILESNIDIYAEVFDSFSQNPEQIIPEARKFESGNEKLQNVYVVRYSTTYLNGEYIEYMQLMNYLKKIEREKDDKTGNYISMPEEAEEKILHFYVDDNIVSEITIVKY